MENFQAIRSLVKCILKSPFPFDWTVQGFGMLRLNMPDPPYSDFRLNIWDSRYRTPGVSLMHTHPWNFSSLVVSGGLCNLRFKESDDGCLYNFSTIKPGPGGGITQDGKSGTIRLKCMGGEYYSPQQTYEQEWHEIHISNPDDGTITLNSRTRVGEDLAQVFWRVGSYWVTAEPRKATVEEVAAITQQALLIY